MKFRIRVRLKTLLWVVGLFSIAGVISLLDYSHLYSPHETIAKKNFQSRKMSGSLGKSQEDPHPPQLHSPLPLILTPEGRGAPIPQTNKTVQDPNDLPPRFIRHSKGVVPYVEILRNHSLAKGTSCDQKCRLERRRALSKPLIENVELPKDWRASEDLLKRFQYRKQRVKQVCDKYGMASRSPTNQPNAWEYIINEKYNLVWCSIFKAASSTWFFNFNLLAGYSESYLLGYRNTPIALARKKYPRPTVQELDTFMNSTNKPLTFMIVRHPLERLVSGYRDKFLGNANFYRNISRKIISNYPLFGPPVEIAQNNLVRIRRFNAKNYAPSFKQFVEYVIDKWKNGERLDEHWERMERFCTPCIVDMDVFAKVETLDEDGNFIIFNSGIEKVIKPKRINRSKIGPTDSVVYNFLCSLSSRQMQDLVAMYKMDLEMFEYDFEKYLECTAKNNGP